MSVTVINSAVHQNAWAVVLVGVQCVFVCVSLVTLDDIGAEQLIHIQTKTSEALIHQSLSYASVFLVLIHQFCSHL